MRINSRALQSKTHRLDTNEGSTILITRIKPPHLILAYNIKTQDSAIIECDKIEQDKLDAAIKKAIAFAKHKLVF